MHLSDDRVRAAMRTIRRERFLPDDVLPFAGEDRALPIGHGQTCSQPTTVLHLLSLLDVPEGAAVLDVGSGSAWSTALIGWLVGPAGRVRGVERVPELVALGRGNLAGTDLRWVTVEPARVDTFGLPEHAPYDRILVSAEADEIPDALVQQLGPTGRLVVPVRGRLVVVQNVPDAEPTVEYVGAYRFVPLVPPVNG